MYLGSGSVRRASEVAPKCHMKLSVVITCEEEEIIYIQSGALCFQNMKV